MVLTLSFAELSRQAGHMIEAANGKTIFIEKDGERVAAIVSMDVYGSTHEAKVERALAAMDALSAPMASVATPEELARHNI